MDICIWYGDREVEIEYYPKPPVWWLNFFFFFFRRRGEEKEKRLSGARKLRRERRERERRERDEREERPVFVFSFLLLVAMYQRSVVLGGSCCSAAATASARRAPSISMGLNSGASHFSCGGAERRVGTNVRNGAVVFAMRHRAKRHLLSRPSDQRKALLRSLTTELLRHGRIKTTKQKAKAIVEHVDKVITWAKQASKVDGAKAEHKKNLAKSFLYDDALVANIFEEAAERYEDRPGGYTRITPTAARRGDNSAMVYIELV